MESISPVWWGKNRSNFYDKVCKLCTRLIGIRVASQNGMRLHFIFCLSILLSALGHFLMSEINAGFTMQLGINVVGIMVMCLTAAMLDWYRAVQQMPITTVRVVNEGE